MKTFKISKMATAAAMSLLAAVLWTGCASNPNEGQPGVETTVDLLHRGPDTHPEYSHDMIWGNPAQAVWTVETLE